MRKLIFLLLVLVGMMLFVACGANEAPAEPDYIYNGSSVPTGAIELENFTLESANGPISLEDFAGQYVIVYFGYTFCPDFCPVTLSQMERVRSNLGDRANDLQVVMISVDPERDTPDKLAEYVTFFDPSFIGLTGTKEQIDAAAAPFGVFYEIGEVAENKDYYLVNHTTRTFLIGPEGDALLTWSHDTPASGISADLNYLMGIQPTES